MFTRRFTIVFLLTTLFGMGLAILVAENSRNSIRLAASQPTLCTMAPFGPCAPGLFR
jgi:hypothetical protein